MESRIERSQKKQLKNKLIINTILVGAAALIILGIGYKYLY